MSAQTFQTETFTPAVEAVAALHDDIDRLIGQVDGDDIALITLLRDARTARQQLATIERALEDAAARAWPRTAGNRIALSNEWVAERRFGADRTKWDNDGLTADLVRKVTSGPVVDESTGELCEPNAMTWALRDALVACARPSWRTTKLREHGIDPDEYCHKEKGRVTVQIIPASEATDD
jgi:hypothetical protein